MKVMCLFLSLSLLVSGCYSSALLRVDKSAADDRDAKFYLQDSSRVESEWNRHKRVEGGYQVDGRRIKDGEEQEFHGLIRDQDIVKIEADEFDTGSSILVGVFVIGGLTAILLVAASNAHIGPDF